MSDRTLVVVFLRGGADGLALVPPKDPLLESLRPALIPESVDLDSRFAMHVALAPLLPLYQRGSMGIVHAVGSSDSTRSHFEAQDQMEHGDDRGGWISRWMTGRNADLGALSLVAVGQRSPESLRGSPAAVFERASEMGLASDAITRGLSLLYRGDDAIETAGASALRALEVLGSIEGEPPGSAESGPLGRRLAELARVLKLDVGVRIACVDHDGWDTHVLQPTAIATQAQELGSALRTFMTELGDRARSTTVLVMSEFGRRAYENTSLGTDHGRASVMFALGAGVRGGNVFARWPGLHDDALEPPGDLAVTTDYRDVLAELIASLGDDPAPVFPGFRPRPVGLFEAAS